MTRASAAAARAQAAETSVGDISVRAYDLEGVRKAPGMYVGGTDAEALRIIVKEVIDNAADQMTKGAARQAVVMRLADGAYAVWDDGEGIPVETHPVAKLSGLTVVMTQLHAGTKSSAATKDRFRGVHGVGVSVTNAMSKAMTVYTFRNKAWHAQSFAAGKPSTAKPIITQLPLWTKSRPGGASFARGTLVVFEPDRSLFTGGTDVPHDVLRAMVKANAYVLPKTQWTYAVQGPVAWDAETFCAPSGLLDLLTDTLQDQEAQPHGKPFVYTSDDLTVVAQWTTGAGCLASSVNGSPTPRGGTHATAVLTALKASLPAKGKVAITPEDCTNGLVCLIDAKVLRPTFNAQTKDALRSEMPEAVGPALLAAWQTFWALNKKLAQDVVKLCTASAEERLAHTTRKADLRTFSATQKDLGRVAKSNFRPAQQKDLTQCTLFLVEGKSAGGCAIQARDPKTQAVLSLRGKILNVLRTSHTKALANAEIATLLSVLGYSDKDPTWTSRTYKEVVLLVDPDEDGGHISILLLGFFLKYAPGILQERRLLRVTDAALFKAYVNGKYTFGRTLQDVRSKVSASAHITRIKGWGEIDPDTLRFVGMAPATRQLIRIAAPPPYAASLIKTLLSSGTESLKARRLLLGLPPKAPFDSSMDNLELDMA